MPNEINTPENPQTIPNLWDIGISINIGEEREKQEDIIMFKELDRDSLLTVIADGTQSREGCPQPGSIVATDIIDSVTAFFNDKKSLFMTDPEYFLKLQMYRANVMLGVFSAANEEVYSGYAASVTCLLLTKKAIKKKDGSKELATMMYAAHVGNTRLYIIRGNIIKQLTTDHTVAARLLAEGVIKDDEYYNDPRRLSMTSGLGLVAYPEIQTLSGRAREGDLFVLTTDGVHYAVNTNAIAYLTASGTSTVKAAEALVNGALDQKYPDNMAAAVIMNADFRTKQLAKEG